jgi:hypothetical protein
MIITLNCFCIDRITGRKLTVNGDFSKSAWIIFQRVFTAVINQIKELLTWSIKNHYNNDNHYHYLNLVIQKVVYIYLTETGI